MQITLFWFVCYMVIYLGLQLDVYSILFLKNKTTKIHVQFNFCFSVGLWLLVTGGMISWHYIRQTMLDTFMHIFFGNLGTAIRPQGNLDEVNICDLWRAMRKQFIYLKDWKFRSSRGLSFRAYIRAYVPFFWTDRTGLCCNESHMSI